jgi:hypothetical protein
MAKKTTTVGFVTTDTADQNRLSGPVRPEPTVSGGTDQQPGAQAAIVSPSRPDFAMVEQILERAATFGF